MKKLIEFDIPKTETGWYVIQIEKPNGRESIAYIAKEDNDHSMYDTVDDITEARRFKRYEAVYFCAYLNEYYDLHLNHGHDHDLYEEAFVLAYPKRAKNHKPTWLGQHHYRNWRISQGEN